MISIFNRRLVSLASASALIATMAVATAPAAAFAAHCTPTGFTRDSNNLTAAQIGGTVTGGLDATGCDIGAYNPTRVVNADIHGARYYGVVVDGRTNINTTNSKIHQIGNKPFDGTQHGRAVLYINGASGTISGNKVYDFQKNGIEVRGVTADASAPSSDKTTATIANNVVTGLGHVPFIAQNGIVVLGNASATMKNNTVSHFWYTGTADTTATALLNVDVPAGNFTVSGNRILDAQVRIDGAVTANVLGHSTTTVRPHSVRVDLFSNAKPAPQAELGTKLDWKVRVDGRLKRHVKQGFGEQTVFIQPFATGSGRHVVKVFKNDVLVKTTTVRF